MIFSVLIDGRRRLRSASCGGPNQRIAEISHTSGAIFFIGNYRITRGKWPAKMLDKPEKTRDLIAILEAALPFEVALMPELIERLAR